MGERVDLLVVGGGINGVGIARDAAGRGLAVLLCDKGDLAGATSSASSKLIHGGLRYLEHGSFRLVRESLAEREVLLRMAPHLVRPLRLVLPQGPGSRPAALVRLGLYLYDRIGGAGSLPGAARLDLRRDASGAPLRDDLRAGFSYSDCRTDDARLTVVSARDAAMRGVEIATRTEFVEARRQGGVWRVRLRRSDGAVREVAARVLVNAAGPWVLEVLRRAELSSGARLRLVQGSHIVVPKLYEGEHGYLLQNDDRRVVFVLPFEHEFSLIGTTELPFAGDPAEVRISSEEIAYLCRAVGRWFAAAPAPADVVWSFAGVRPLYDDSAASPAAVTRDYVFDLDSDGPPMLSVFGGKLTTYRRLAEAALARLAPFLPGIGPAWTAASVLPGGEGCSGEAVRQRYPFLEPDTAARLSEAYGGDTLRILGNATSAAGLGRDFGAGLSEAELRWLVREEWARTAEDVLWRRSKLGLRMSAAEGAAVADFLAEVGDNVRGRAAPHPSPLPAGGEREGGV